VRPVLHGLAENPALPAELVDQLIACADDELAGDLADRADLTSAQLTALARHDSAAIRLAHAGRLRAADVEIDPATRPLVALALTDAGGGDPSWLPPLAAHPSAQVRERLAACPDLPAGIVRRLAEDPVPGVAAEMARHAPDGVADALAAHPHAEVRRGAAANDATSPAVLAALLTGEGLPPASSCLVCDQEPIPFRHDPHCPRVDCALPPGAACDGSHESTVHDIQRAALGNPATPAEAAAAFVDHPAALLREELAARTDQPREIYLRLAQDPIPFVRERLASNPATDTDVMRLLSFGHVQGTHPVLAQRPDIPLDVLAHVLEKAKVGVLLPRVAAAIPEEVARLAASPNPKLRAHAARRRDLPPAIRDALADDPDPAVAKSIAPDPALTETQLRAMVARHGGRVVAKVASNPSAPAELLIELTRRQPTVQKALREIARNPNAPASALLACLADHQARRWAARHPALPSTALVALLDDADEQVAIAAASNPALPQQSARQLVRRAVGGTSAWRVR
jgi:hypothetical protein